MFRPTTQQLTWYALIFAAGLSAGCTTMLPHGGCHTGGCQTGGCDSGMCGTDGCSDCGHGKSKWYKFGKKDKCQSCDDGCGQSCGTCGGCGTTCCLGAGGMCGGCLARRSLAIPDIYPVGSLQRAHFHQMQTNAEASDFILHEHDFVLETAELTPDGKDKILEIAARMRSAPFPVLVERTMHNANPELDAHRRAIVAQILTDLGNTDANGRVIVSPAYNRGKTSMEAAPEFNQFIFSGGGNNNFNNGGFGNGAGGGFGGGGGGFGGGGFGGF